MDTMTLLLLFNRFGAGSFNKDAVISASQKNVFGTLSTVSGGLIEGEVLLAKDLNNSGEVLLATTKAIYKVLPTGAVETIASKELKFGEEKNWASCIAFVASEKEVFGIRGDLSLVKIASTTTAKITSIDLGFESIVVNTSEGYGILDYSQQEEIISLVEYGAGVKKVSGMNFHNTYAEVHTNKVVFVAGNSRKDFTPGGKVLDAKYISESTYGIVTDTEIIIKNFGEAKVDTPLTNITKGRDYRLNPRSSQGGYSPKSLYTVMPNGELREIVDENITGEETVLTTKNVGGGQNVFATFYYPGFGHFEDEEGNSLGYGSASSRGKYSSQIEGVPTKWHFIDGERYTLGIFSTDANKTYVFRDASLTEAKLSGGVEEAEIIGENAYFIKTTSGDKFLLRQFYSNAQQIDNNHTIVKMYNEKVITSFGNKIFVYTGSAVKECNFDLNQNPGAELFAVNNDFIAFSSNESTYFRNYTSPFSISNIVPGTVDDVIEILPGKFIISSNGKNYYSEMKAVWGWDGSKWAYSIVPAVEIEGGKIVAYGKNVSPSPDATTYAIFSDGSSIFVIENNGRIFKISTLEDGIQAGEIKVSSFHYTSGFAFNDASGDTVFMWGSGQKTYPNYGATKISTKNGNANDIVGNEYSVL